MSVQLPNFGSSAENITMQYYMQMVQSPDEIELLQVARCINGGVPEAVSYFKLCQGAETQQAWYVNAGKSLRWPECIGHAWRPVRPRVCRGLCTRRFQMKILVKVKLSQLDLYLF